jgi:hypothetical protein
MADRGMSDPPVTNPRDARYRALEDDMSNATWGWIGVGVVVVLALIFAIGFGREDSKTAANNPPPITTGTTPPAVTPAPPSTTGTAPRTEPAPVRPAQPPIQQ